MSALWRCSPASGSGRPPPTTTTATTRSPRKGPSAYATSERRAEAFARVALKGRRSARCGGFWYATIRSGRVVDPIGEGHPHDREFEPEPDWSRTLLAEDDQ